MISAQSFQTMIAGLNTVDKMEHLICELSGPVIERARFVAQEAAELCVKKIPDGASYRERMWLDVYYRYMYEVLSSTLFHSWKSTWF